MDKRRLLWVIPLAVVLALLLNIWTDHTLAEARRMMCAEGSLRADLCPAQTRNEQ